EGTRIEKKTGNTEENVFETAGEFVSKVPGLVAVNFPARDLARLKTFHRIAKNTGRKLVLSFKHAYLLEQFSALGGGEYPPINDPQLCFYADRKGWGLAGRNDYPQNIVEQDYGIWEREYLHLDNTINSKDIRKHQEHYLFYCNYFQLNELVDVDPKPGSRYVRSVCEPFSDEMLFDERRVKNWLELFGLGEAYQIHASGHASGSEITKMISKINPKIIYPVHTESNALFVQRFKQAKTIEKGEQYTI
ncbi:MBL fold metallo-hydrolase, partial [Candidatus Bathyarchaeota archaeon]|nr:MBL fold metallo-hydrolase [Candidatus Bathyarchaeota archaeon]